MLLELQHLICIFKLNQIKPPILKRTIFLLLLCMASIGQAIGQSYSFRSYRAENGLSYNSVICSVQDSRGFMWFGTKDGLNKFDGYTFKVFRNDKRIRKV